MHTPDSFILILQRALNEYLALDPETAVGLNELDGQLIAIEIAGLGLAFYLRVENGGICVTAESDEPPATRLRGAPVSMARLMLAEEDASSLFGGNIEVEGDTETGQRLREILRSINVDWEELLSSVTGDLVARQVTRAGQGARGWARRTTRNLRQDVTDFAQEETRILPHPVEVKEFLDGVDAVRDQLERAAARIARIERALDNTGDDADGYS